VVPSPASASACAAGWGASGPSAEATSQRHVEPPRAVPSMQQRLVERGERARAASGQPLPVLRGVDVDSAAVHVGGVAGRSPGWGARRSARAEEPPRVKPDGPTPVSGSA
jgi:hypothetical protein